MRKKLIIIFTLIKFFEFVFTYHYRGGTISARSLSSTVLEVRTSFGWQLGGFYCDQETIQNHELIGPLNDFIYSEDTEVSSVETYCESFSTSDDWSYGIKKFNLTTFNKQLRLLYEGCCWISPYDQHLNWQIRMSVFNVSVINSSPFAVMFPISNLLKRCFLIQE